MMRIIGIAAIYDEVVVTHRAETMRLHRGTLRAALPVPLLWGHDPDDEVGEVGELWDDRDAFGPVVKMLATVFDTDIARRVTSRWCGLSIGLERDTGRVFEVSLIDGMPGSGRRTHVTGWRRIKADQAA